MRAFWKVFRWLDARGPPPYVADWVNHEDAWDYEQADLQLWDAEPDEDRLLDALRLWESAPARAFTELHVLAEQNSRIAINAIGECYYWGNGVATDRQEGERWFKRAFDLGSWRGLLNYGKALFHRRDFDDAKAVFHRGVEYEWGPAYYWLSRVEGAQSGLCALKRIRPQLERAADLGSPAAKSTVAALMSAGVYGVRQIPRGWRLLGEASKEQRAMKIVPRVTSSGDTVH
jgi:tetratricopeptide (TPR) repeat protein